MKPKKTFALRKEKRKPNLGKSSRPEFIFYTRNPLNFIFKFNQGAQFLTNLILKDKIKKSI